MIIDILAVLLIGIGAWSGYRRGLLKTVVASLSIMTALVASLKLSPVVIAYLRHQVDWHPGLVFILGFIFTFFAVLILIRWMGTQLERFMKILRIQALNQLAGGALLGAMYALVVGGVLALANAINVLPVSWTSQSVIFDFLTYLPKRLASHYPSLKALFQSFWYELNLVFDHLAEAIEK